jgi:hypothetical protein
VEVGARPEIDEPVGGTTTGRVTVDRPELVLGATNWRPLAVDPGCAERVGEEPYRVGR